LLFENVDADGHQLGAAAQSSASTPRRKVLWLSEASSTINTGQNRIHRNHGKHGTHVLFLHREMTLPGCTLFLLSLEVEVMGQKNEKFRAFRRLEGMGLPSSDPPGLRIRPRQI